VNVNGDNLRRRSTVKITGELKDSNICVVHNLGLEHDAGAPDAALLGEAFKMLRSAGGLMADEPDGSIYFYPLTCFSRVHLEVQKVVIQSVAGVH